MATENLYEGFFTYKFNDIKITADGSDFGQIWLLNSEFWNTFTGSYIYRSPTVDGRFGLPAGTNQGPLVEFILKIPLPIGYDYTDYSFHRSEVPGPLVTVSGGVVTDFTLNNEIGPVGLSFDFGTFKVGKSAGDGWHFGATGEIHFENPKLAAIGIPPGP